MIKEQIMSASNKSNLSNPLQSNENSQSAYAGKNF